VGTLFNFLVWRPPQTSKLSTSPFRPPLETAGIKLGANVTAYGIGEALINSGRVFLPQPTIQPLTLQLEVVVSLET
jgi:hypothetical protein